MRSEKEGPDQNLLNVKSSQPNQSKSFSIRNTAEILHQRLDSLNHLARRRSSFALDGISRDEKTLSYDTFLDDCQIKTTRGAVLDASSAQILAHRDPDMVPNTDAGKRLEIIFERFTSEREKDPDVPKKPVTQKKGLNRIQVKRSERRKKSIQTLQNQLAKNSSHFLSRSANSLRFHIRRDPNSSFQYSNLSSDEFPIPVSEVEMDPHLLLTLSCEKLAVDRGKRLLKAIVLQKISKDLFVLMFWFIHCRFFQKHSSSEQRYLLTKIACVFPIFITMLKGAASSKERDVIFRFYPFVLAKGIFMGFKYLCPGNQNLFKGAFQRILYLSIFRLLTGLDICPESVDALRLKLYPEDMNEEETSDANTEQDNELRPMGDKHEPNKSEEIQYSPHVLGKRSPESYLSPGSRNVRIHNKRDSLIKFVGDRESLRFRPAKTELLGPQKLLRQQQVLFDAYQISPLLQQYLGRESNSIGPKHTIKRTEPVSYCQSGGVKTYQCRTGTLVIQEEDEILKEHKRKRDDLRKTSQQASLSNRKQLKALASQQDQILTGTKANIREFADSIISSSKKEHYSITDDNPIQKVLSCSLK